MLWYVINTGAHDTPSEAWGGTDARHGPSSKGLSVLHVSTFRNCFVNTTDTHSMAIDCLDAYNEFVLADVSQTS